MYRKAVLSDSNAICGLVCGQEGLELSREKFYDASDHRNQGIGTGLFEQALELAQGFRCRHLEVSCRMEEESGRRFFEKRGLLASYVKLEKQL